MLRLVQGDCRPSALDDEPIVEWGALGPDEAARIVRLYGRTTVIVSTRASAPLRGIVARHALRWHGTACTGATCAHLWPWLRARTATA